jgi:hypothetical protein
MEIIMTKITPLSDITTLQNIAATINANNDKVEVALENTLSLDGSTPNSMGADLDLNSFSLINVATLNGVVVDTLSANLDIVAALSDSIIEVAENATNISTVAADTIAINAASGNAAAAAASAADALVSEGNAATSEAAAAASYNSFDDRYLGAKAVEPTLDNDGDALLTGALYFNTVTEDMWVYTGTAWAVAYVSLGDALLANANLSDLDSATTALTNLGLTSNGKSLVTAADYASMRTLLGLGTAALTASTSYATSAQGTLADLAAPRASPTLTGTPLAPTAASGTNTTQIATTAFVNENRGYTWFTPVATTSGTAFDFTGVPTWATEIILSFGLVSLSGADSILVQVGTSAGLDTTNYSSTGMFLSSGGSSGLYRTDGFGVHLNLGTRSFSGHMIITKGVTNNWIESHSGQAGASEGAMGGGRVALSGVLDRIRVKNNGASTFDAGNITVGYR